MPLVSELYESYSKLTLLIWWGKRIGEKSNSDLPNENFTSIEFLLISYFNDTIHIFF